MTAPLVCQSSTENATTCAVAAPVVVRSWTGTQTRVHNKRNHGEWLHISLFLVELAARGAGPGRGTRHEAGTRADLSALPHGNHGENKSLSEVLAGDAK